VVPGVHDATGTLVVTFAVLQVVLMWFGAPLEVVPGVQAELCITLFVTLAVLQVVVM
jgi:hypothetical protein